MQILITKKMESLPGVTLTVDDHNNRVIIVLDKEKYAEVWQDFYDGLLSESRKDEPTISLEALKAELKAEGSL